MISYVWATGLGVAVIILAGKAGFISGIGSWSLFRVVALASAYAGLFLLTGYLSGAAPHFISRTFSFLGMAAYLFLAGGFILLGVVLIKVFANMGISPQPKLGLLLLFSSPLYLLLIVMSVFLFTSISGVEPFKVSGILAGVFAFTVVLLARLFKRYKNIRFANFLGFAMIMAGLYFVVSVGIVPVYTRALSVIHIVQGSGFSMPSIKLVALLVVVFTIFLFGFLKKRREFIS